MSSAQTGSIRLASCMHVRQTEGYWLHRAKPSREAKRSFFELVNAE